ncbi:putative transcriptional regulator [Natronobacillus azotifigens]|uniref:Uncharacterized protein n=1 Tax=Natronobacillus azotifigens TaxID=472978 RepID=A0A9J6RFK1_9BACI|nr:hypothetical protein [Natronobacillus azotifigens]MCZ0704205.1 hypothetical protein [Natronobacillus azotifigens]
MCSFIIVVDSIFALHDFDHYFNDFSELPVISNPALVGALTDAKNLTYRRLIREVT